jgi:hypothetical protein
MKKTTWLALVACLFAVSATTAQDCKTYYYLQNNKTIEMTIYNKKGDESGKQVSAVSDVKNSGGATIGSINSEMFDKKGKSIAKSKGTIQCKGGVMMVDMKMALSPQQQEQFATDAKADNLYMEYPANMKAGDKLKDATMDLTIDNSGMKQSVKMVVSDRNVEGKESVTTTAGTWECYKISFKSKVTIKTVGIGIPINMDGTEWFAPGFGVVKTQSKHGGTAITAIK